MRNRQIINSIKNTEYDFEFYPTSYEMLEPIYKEGHVDGKSILDIGAGTCNFKNYYEKYQKDKEQAFNLLEDIKEQQAKSKNENYYRREYEKKYINQYFVIEKSKPLIDLFDNETICLGTDFWIESLIDKPVDIIFCNPPYSEYEDWCEKIITQGNCNVIYLVIPQRWKDSNKINNAIQKRRFNVSVLGHFDFLNAERQARAKVEIIQMIKPYYSYSSQKPTELNESAFDSFFDAAFKFNEEIETEEQENERIANQLADSKANRAKVLVDLYEQEKQQLQHDIEAVCQMRSSTLKTLGISKDSVKAALKQKLKGLKISYWNKAINELDEVTSRLTSTTREKLFTKFSSINTVEFTYDNIYPLVVWVLKNSSQYYDEQLITFYKRLTAIENVKLYKSNQRVFSKDNWRFKQEVTHYVLDYRIVCSSFFKTTYSGNLDHWDNPTVIDDICTIANNLGFIPEEKKFRQLPKETGIKYYIKLKDGSILMEYKLYKNGNIHIKLNIEFAKAMNVEVSRLLGWIRNKGDIEKEFPSELAKGAEKYFKAHNNLINLNSGIKLLAK